MRKQKILWYAAAILAVLGTVCLSVRGVRFTGYLCWGAALYAIAYAVLDRLAAEKKWAKHGARALLVLLCAGLALFLYMEGRVIAGARDDAAVKDVSCVIVLGAGVDGTVPSLSLRTRLDAALDYVADKPELPIVVSGGQGAGEEITEAECMARWLIAHGIDEERILREERSTNTRENFRYSLELLSENGVDVSRGVAFVTSDYHIARSKLLSGLPRAYGVAAHMPRSAYYDALEVNYYVREAFGLAYELIFGA